MMSVARWLAILIQGSEYTWEHCTFELFVGEDVAVDTFQYWDSVRICDHCACKLKETTKRTPRRYGISFFGLLSERDPKQI